MAQPRNPTEVIVNGLNRLCTKTIHWIKNKNQKPKTMNCLYVILNLRFRKVETYWKWKHKKNHTTELLIKKKGDEWFWFTMVYKHSKLTFSHRHIASTDKYRTISYGGKKHPKLAERLLHIGQARKKKPNTEAGKKGWNNLAINPPSSPPLLWRTIRRELKPMASP